MYLLSYILLKKNNLTLITQNKLMFFFKNTLYILCFTYWAISLKLKVLNYPAIIFSPTPQNVTNLATLLDPFNFNLLFLTSYTKKIVNVLVKHISHIFSFF